MDLIKSVSQRLTYQYVVENLDLKVYLYMYSTVNFFSCNLETNASETNIEEMYLRYSKVWFIKMWLCRICHFMETVYSHKIVNIHFIQFHSISFNMELLIYRSNSQSFFNLSYLFICILMLLYILFKSCDFWEYSLLLL